MLSSICVATITGLPAARQARVSRFWIGGTCCTGSSTPRSPRATMMPSEASRISAKALTAAGFSIFDRIAARPSASSRASKTSLGRCTKLSASQSTPSSQANSRSFLSFADERRQRQHHVGHVDALAVRDLAADDHLGQRVLRRAFGDLQPDLAVVDQQRRARPRAPAKISGCGRQTRVASPSAVSRSKRKAAPFSSITGPSAKVPQRSFGPCRSARIADRPADVGLDLRGPARAAARCRRGCRGSCSAGTRRRRR